MAVKPESDRAAWLSERRSRVGGSDVAGILGVSPWASPWSVWADKVGLTPLEGAATDSMNLGRDLEPVIARWFQRDSGLYVHGEQMVLHHPEYDWAGVTVDGLVLEPGSDDIDSAIGIFEAKYDSGQPWDVVPDHYRAQVTWAMLCCELRHAWIACMHLPFGRPQFRVYEEGWDGAYALGVLAAVENFWFEHVVAGVAPKPDDHPATERAIAAAAAWIRPEPEPVVDLADHRDVVTEWRRLKTQEAAIVKQRKACEVVLRPLLLDVSEGCLDGQLVLSYRAHDETRVDVDAVRRDHGHTYDRTKAVRRLLSHEPKAARRSA